jgi:hypothetical protein
MADALTFGPVTDHHIAAVPWVFFQAKTWVFFGLFRNYDTVGKSGLRPGFLMSSLFRWDGRRI